MMTRDEARERWKASGLTRAELTDESVKDLRDRISAALRSSGLIDGFRANPAPKVKIEGDQRFAAITCAAFYFTKREAVTFNRDGFIGFAGWADDKNVQPILEAFCGWVADLELKAMRALVDRVDVAPEFFTRADGTRMAVMSAEFYDKVHAAYVDATAEELTSDHPFYADSDPAP